MNEEKRQQVIALGRLGWPLRRIQQETGVRRETAGAYLKAAGIAVRPPRGWGRKPAKPANAASPDSAPVPMHSCGPTASACEPHRDFIELSLSKGRNAKAIYQDLVDDYGFAGRYQSVKRVVRQLRGSALLQACPIIVTPPGEDYGESGVMVRTWRRFASARLRAA